MIIIKKFIINPHEFWFSLAGLLLVIEIIGSGGYLFWSGISAAIVAIFVFFIPFSWLFQGCFFAFLIVINAILWSYLIHYFNKHNKTLLNRCDRQMIGLRTKLIRSTHNGFSRVKIADSSWRVYSDVELNIDATVEVIGIDGNTLYVKPVHICKTYK